MKWSWNYGFLLIIRRKKQIETPGESKNKQNKHTRKWNQSKMKQSMISSTGGRKSDSWRRPMWDVFDVLCASEGGSVPRDSDSRWTRLPKRFAEMRVERKKFKHVAESWYVTKPERQWIGSRPGKGEITIKENRPNASLAWTLDKTELVWNSP